jgi:hypothetical protein
MQFSTLVTGAKDMLDIHIKHVGILTEFHI